MDGRPFAAAPAAGAASSAWYNYEHVAVDLIVQQLKTHIFSLHLSFSRAMQMQIFALLSYYSWS
jgi:hypothetical protein